MNRADMLNGGSYSRTARQTGNATTTDAEVNGAWVSRKADVGDLALSAKLVVNYTATLSAGESLTLAGTFQDAIDGSGTGVADYGGDVAAFEIAVGDSGGSTETGTAEIDIDLSGAREFIRGQYTLGTSGSGTTAHSAVIVFYGDSRQPVTKSPVNVGSADAI